MKNRQPVIVFIGQPNCGKSTLFNALAGYKAQTSNFPGTTVKHTHSKVNLRGKVLNIIDLPGTYSLNPVDPAEKVVLSHVYLEKPDLIINVIDASILGRSLELTVELIELGYPLVVALNMMDLAEKKGIKVNTEKLERILGVPVVPTVATHGRGVKVLIEKAFETLDRGMAPSALKWSKDVEEKIEELKQNLPPDYPLVANKKFTAIKMIESEQLFFDKLLKEKDPQLRSVLISVRKALEKLHNAPAYEVISAERHHLAMKIFEESSSVQRGRKIGLGESIDSLIMHPFYGYFFLILIFFSFFFVIFKIGNPLEEIIFGPFEALRNYLHEWLGQGLLFSLTDGLLMGIGGGAGVVLPYFVPLIFLMSILEDIGYLSRASFLMDTFMHRIGLHGKSVAPFILGFGCNVPAVMSTRILESHRDRLVTSLLIPFIPCSARTTIILALVAFYLGPFWALGFYIFNIILVGILGWVLSLFLKEPSPGLILEIPSLKIPSLMNVWKKTYIQLKAFIRFAWPILIGGSVLLALMNHVGFDRTVNVILSPLVEQALGLPRQLGVTLIFGFLRKELSLIMLLQAAGVSYAELLTVITKEQVFIFTVFVSLFIPCLSTFAILWKEMGWRVAFLSAGLNTTVAVVVSILLRLVLHL